ncbi:MAG: hypothetical protein RIC35_06150 [Marinoscillum sp.]
MKIQLFSVLFVLILVNFAHCQDHFSGLSATPKIGYFNWHEDNGGWAGGIDINYLRNNWNYSIGYMNLPEWGLFSTTPIEYYHEIRAVAGQYADVGIFRFDYQLGGSLFSGLKRTTVNTNRKSIYDDYYNSEKFAVFGLAMKGGISFVLLPVMSLGLDFHLNINSKTLIYSPMISLEIGKLKNEPKEP